MTIKNNIRWINNILNFHSAEIIKYNSTAAPKFYLEFDNGNWAFFRLSKRKYTVVADEFGSSQYLGSSYTDSCFSLTRFFNTIDDLKENILNTAYKKYFESNSIENNPIYMECLIKNYLIESAYNIAYPCKDISKIPCLNIDVDITITGDMGTVGDEYFRLSSFCKSKLRTSEGYIPEYDECDGAGSKFDYWN